MPALDVLEGERVRLRQPRADDAGAMFAGMASDPSVTRYLSWAPHLTVTETRRVILEEFNSGADPTWLVERADDGAFVGTCGWRWLEPHAVDLGYCLGRNWWGQGLATEAATLMVAAACSDPRVYRISAYGRGAAPLWAGAGGAAGPVRGLPQPQPRAAGLSVVRQSGPMNQEAR